MTSASPLLGRGDNDIIRISSDDGDFGDIYLPDLPEAPSADEFEFFGPSALVDTQTAESSQWLRSAIHQETMRYFEFVKHAIGQRMNEELTLNEVQSITFAELVSPKTDTKLVAAQAFLHTLTLATTDKIRIEQQNYPGDISIRLI
jgi:meiotic recombination protein REC8